MTLNLHLNQEATQALITWARETRDSSQDPFEAARTLVTRLGAHVRGAQAEFGFYVPGLAKKAVPPVGVFLEVLRPVDIIDLRAARQSVRFERARVPLIQDDEYWWAVLEGAQPGTRDRCGDFYRLAYQDAAGDWQFVHDPLAHSLPFGAFSPPELYDMETMFQARTDKNHFSGSLDTAPDPDGTPRVKPPANILQLHIKTASAEGTLEGLTRIYQRIAEKIRAGEPLTPAEENYAGYDSVQLMPIEPVIEFEGGLPFFQVVDGEGDTLEVELLKPDMTNWGYDVVMLGSSATNPAVLGSRRPDELLDFIAAMHNFPGKPIKVLFDIVYGHIDNQALGLLGEYFFAGANMYGQNVRFQHPVVRAMLLEMQRRKHNYGVDGVRVDGAQDFKNWNPESGQMEHDDDYLRLMNDLEQEAAGVRYRPYMIFEDGRPWPRDDWELSSTYREVTKQMPNVWQWGPLTFAHNTPFLFTFWISKWWRIQEITQVGGRWITGCANHDTLRRGTQVPLDARINTYLGDTLPEIFKKAYDNPASKMFDYACMPGIPMDFINASMRAPWSFVRNTDDRYGVKVVSEESRFLHWVVNEEQFRADWAFPRLKAMGFTGLEGLRRFLTTLDHAVQATGYSLPAIVTILQTMDPPLAGPPLSVETLKRIARAWMDDVHEYCNVAHYQDALDPAQAAYNLALRKFRRARQWLQDDFLNGDYFDYLRPCDGSVVFYGLRSAPDGSEQVLFVANMEGAPRTVIPRDLPFPSLSRDGWQPALASPGLDPVFPDQPVVLHDSEGLAYTRKTK